MDFIEHVLALAPVPYLSTAFSLLKFIWTSIEQVQASREQLKVLTICIAELLQVLDTEYRAQRLLMANTAPALDSLHSLLEEILAFVRKQATYGFIKTLYKKDEQIAQIEGYHRRAGASVASFQISALVSLQDWQIRDGQAQSADQLFLHDRLDELEGNQSKLAKALDVQHNNITAMMASLQRRLDQQVGGDREQEFFSRSLRYLSTTSGQYIQLEDWMVTSYDVEFGPEIGAGGFGQVRKGSWNGASVAIKVLQPEGGIAPRSAAIAREVKTWSKLLHPHILQFLGANVLDGKPFIVMPYLKNGNARDYINKHPKCNRQQILHHVSLGLLYLHSRNIVHGDLKALNVLIDDGQRAVLCDFGLTCMKADVTSRTTTAGPTIVSGSRNWMAPERLKGGSLKKPCDIYAFGMVIYEIHTCEIPLGHVGYSEFPELVIEQGVRPDHPDNDDAPQLTDDVWRLAERCWNKDPSARPSISTVCDTLSHLLNDGDHTPINHTPIMVAINEKLVPGVRYHVMNVATGSLLDLHALNLTHVISILTDRHLRANQQWIFTQTMSGWTIQSAYTGQYLAIRGNPEVGKRVLAVPDAFEWDLTTSTQSSWTHRISVKSLAVAFKSGINFSPAVLETADTGDRQSWMFSKVLY